MTYPDLLVTEIYIHIYILFDGDFLLICLLQGLDRCCSKAIWIQIYDLDTPIQIQIDDTHLPIWIQIYSLHPPNQVHKYDLNFCSLPFLSLTRFLNVQGATKLICTLRGLWIELQASANCMQYAHTWRSWPWSCYAVQPGLGKAFEL